MAPARPDDTVAATAKTVLGVQVKDPSWFKPVRRVTLTPGALAPKATRVPQGDAQRVLRSVVRLVADLPAGSTPEVVWQQGASQLLVHTDTIGLACKVGLVTMAVRVDCDQVDGPVTVEVPLAVGTEDAPAGLVMTALSRLDGPEVVTAVWSDALTAFCWEALVELARQLCAALGRDSRNRPLVPGSIGSASRTLLLQPVARHEFELRLPR